MATYFSQRIDELLPPSMQSCLAALTATSTEKINLTLTKLENSMDEHVNGKDISYLSRLIHSHIALQYEFKVS